MPDIRFALPAIDDPGSTEAGVVLLGLDAERLLAGLGLARIADDPALVTEAVDRARHGVAGFGLAGLLESGRYHWRSVRESLGPPRDTSSPGSLRQEWTQAFARVEAAFTGAGPAAIAYLTACALRRTEIDRLADPEEISDVLPEVPAG